MLGTFKDSSIIKMFINHIFYLNIGMNEERYFFQGCVTVILSGYTGTLCTAVPSEAGFTLAFQIPCQFMAKLTKSAKKQNLKA